MSNNNYKGNILVVDDTPENLRLLVAVLNEKGYQTRPVPHGKLAISAAQLNPPDLILLDILMPEIDGYEVCTQLKANDKTKQIPVIFLTAVNEVLDKVKAFAVGGVDYITKPFQIEEVLARVETHLALVSTQKSLAAKNEELATKNVELNLTLQQLQSTQEELIHSAKMAALGQLIAGIAHEINNPLSAITSSVRNIAMFWSDRLVNFPEFLQQLSPSHQQYFVFLLKEIVQKKQSLPSREERKLRTALAAQLAACEIENPSDLASLLVLIGIKDIEPFLPLLKEPESENLLQTAYEFANVQSSIRSITTAAERAGKVVFALKNYAHYDNTGNKIYGEITEGIDTVLTLYSNQLKQHVTVIKNYEDYLPSILCYPDELNQVWTNIIHNALQAMEYRGTLTIEVKQQDGKIKASFTDSGKGIPPEIMPKIFQPFFTTKPAGEGSGLGLDIVQKIIDKHGGKIEVESVPGKTTFTISLPLKAL
jgi:two-component system, NtrC family, sensor kinase